MGMERSPYQMTLDFTSPPSLFLLPKKLGYSYERLQCKGKGAWIQEFGYRDNHKLTSLRRKWFSFLSYQIQ